MPNATTNAYEDGVKHALAKFGLALPGVAGNEQEHPLHLGANKFQKLISKGIPELSGYESVHSSDPVSKLDRNRIWSEKVDLAAGQTSRGAPQNVGAGDGGVW